MVNENKTRYYQELSSAYPKIKIEEYANLLKDNSNESKEKVIGALMHYIYNMTQKIYYLYYDEFNAYYSYEDFYQDAVLIATELYVSQKFQDYQGLFYNLYIRIIDLVRNTYFLKVHDYKYRQIKRILNEKEMNPSLNDKQISQKIGLSTKNVNMVKTCDSLEEHQIGYSTFEDDVIEEIDKDILTDKIKTARNILNKRSRDIIDDYYGINVSNLEFNQQSLASLGEKYHLTRKRMWRIIEASKTKIKKYYPELSSF